MLDEKVSKMQNSNRSKAIVRMNFTGFLMNKSRLGICDQHIRALI